MDLSHPLQEVQHLQPQPLSAIVALFCVTVNMKMLHVLHLCVDGGYFSGLNHSGDFSGSLSHFLIREYQEAATLLPSAFMAEFQEVELSE